MPRRPATDEQRDEERVRIRNAAAKIFAAEGIAAISARAVAKEAGVSVGKLYAYYTNLTELMQSLWQGRVQELSETLQAVADRTSDPVDRIRSILDTYVSFAQANISLYKGALMFVRPEALTVEQRQPAEGLPILALLAAAVEEGQALGTVRNGDAMRIAQVLWAGLHGSVALPINIDRFVFGDEAHLAPDMLDALMIYVTSPA